MSRLPHVLVAFRREHAARHTRSLVPDHFRFILWLIDIGFLSLDPNQRTVANSTVPFTSPGVTTPWKNRTSVELGGFLSWRCLTRAGKNHSRLAITSMPFLDHFLGEVYPRRG